MQCVSSGSAFMPRGQMDPEPLLSSLDDPSEYLLVSVSGSARPLRVCWGGNTQKGVPTSHPSVDTEKQPPFREHNSCL